MNKPKTIKWVGGLLLATGMMTSAVYGGIYLNDFTSGGEAVGSVSPAVYAHELPFNIPLAGTGGLSTINMALEPNPLVRTLSGSNTTTASGLTLFIAYENIANPNGASLDICLVASAASATGSHMCFFENTSTATGATVAKAFTGTTATMMWNGDLLLTARSTVDPTTSFKGRIRGTLHQVAGQ